MTKGPVVHMEFWDSEGAQPGDPLCWCGEPEPHGMTNVWRYVTCVACRFVVQRAAEEEGEEEAGAVALDIVIPRAV